MSKPDDVAYRSSLDFPLLKRRMRQCGYWVRESLFQIQGGNIRMAYIEQSEWHISVIRYLKLEIGYLYPAVANTI